MIDQIKTKELSSQVSWLVLSFMLKSTSSIFKPNLLLGSSWMLAVSIATLLCLIEPQLPSSPEYIPLLLSQSSPHLLAPLSPGSHSPTVRCRCVYARSQLLRQGKIKSAFVKVFVCLSINFFCVLAHCHLQSHIEMKSTFVKVFVSLSIHFCKK